MHASSVQLIQARLRFGCLPGTADISLGSSIHLWGVNPSCLCPDAAAHLSSYSTDSSTFPAAKSPARGPPSLFPSSHHSDAVPAYIKLCLACQQVLHIAELLHQVSSRFDKCRAQRYQQAGHQRRPVALKGVRAAGFAFKTGNVVPCSVANSLSVLTAHLSQPCPCPWHGPASAA